MEPQDRAGTFLAGEANDSKAFTRRIEDARNTVKPQERNQTTEPIEFPGPVRFLSTVNFAEIPEKSVLDAQPTSTEINLLNIETVKLANTAAVTVSSFTGGQPGQLVTFLGDGFTTVANNSIIKTNTSSNKLLLANQIYGFVFISDMWVELAASGSSYTAGAGLVLSGSEFRQRSKHITLVGGYPITVSRGAGAGIYAVNSTPPMTRVDSTGFTNVRVTISAEVLTGYEIRPAISYSINGMTSWTDTVIGSSGIYLGAGHQAISSSITLPSNARISDLWVRAWLYMNDNFVGSFSADLSCLTIEFTP